MEEALTLKTSKPSCGHDKLEAPESSAGWTLQLDNVGFLRTFMQRIYKCEKCKATIVIEQAIQLAEAKESKGDEHGGIR